MKFVTIIVVLAIITNTCSASALTFVSGVQKLGVQKLGTSTTEFGLNLYNELRKDTSVKNMFFSPTSLSLGLSMVLLGAKGNIFKSEVDI